MTSDPPRRDEQTPSWFLLSALSLGVELSAISSQPLAIPLPAVYCLPPFPYRMFMRLSTNHQGIWENRKQNATGRKMPALSVFPSLVTLRLFVIPKFKNRRV